VSIAINQEHRELERVARSFLQARGSTAASRRLLDAPADALPDFWPELVALGWTGLYLPEANGRAGFGLSELAVIIEALARSADGRLHGSAGLVLSAEVATLFALALGDDLELVDADCPGVVVEARKNLDPTRRVEVVRCDGAKRIANTDVRSPAECHAAMTWAQWLKRAFSIDIEVCGRCGGSVRVIACIEDQDTIDRILAHLRDKEENPPTLPLLTPQPRASSGTLPLFVEKEPVFSEFNQHGRQ
jgi:hypothetical protein